MIELKNCHSVEDAIDQADVGFIAEPVQLMTVHNPKNAAGTEPRRQSDAPA
jgi:hypothetical protein